MQGGHTRPRRDWCVPWPALALVWMLVWLWAYLAPAALAQSTQDTGEIKLEVDAFGVGNSARPGDWVGVKVRMLDGSPKPRAVIVQLADRDSDGDRPTYRRVITLNPGVSQHTWLYFRLPFQGERTWQLTVHEASESDGTREGRLLASKAVSASQALMVERPTSMIGVVGRQTMGLRQYAEEIRPDRLSGSITAGRGIGDGPEYGHQRTVIVEMPTADDLPDRWQGLAPFGILVWTDADLLRLRGETANALREWVERGGHLVVVLPPAGQAWTNPTSNELFEIMPVVSVSRREAVDFAPYARLLSRVDKPEMPRSGVLHVLTPREGVEPGAAVRVLEGPSGECVVARRIVGAGMVTWIGLYLGYPELQQRGFLDADIFWHRVLGKRGEILTASERDALNQRQQFSIANRQNVEVDAFIQDKIAKRGSAAQGVLLGFVMFLAYWVVAGPLSYGLLKRWGMVQHAWLGYVVSAAIFAMLTWLGATFARPGGLEAAHVTFIDHVHGQRVQRSRSFLTLLVPWYGQATLSIGGADGKDDDSPTPRFNNLLAPWDELQPLGGASAFPDTRPYPVEARSPSRITFPSRSTVKQFQADWAGDLRWAMPAPTVASDGTVLPLQVTTGPTGLELSGSLVHGLPKPLRGTLVMWVKRPRAIPIRPTSHRGDNPPFEADVVSIRAEWEPGVPLDVGEAFTTAAKRAGRLDLLATRYLDQLAQRSGVSFAGPGQLNAVDAETGAAMIAFYDMLGIPTTTAGSAGATKVRASRSATHTLDLSRWCTQPCVIVMGVVGGDDGSEQAAPSPTPLFVDGEPLVTSGMTIVRWVYPLPDSPPSAALPAADPDPAADP